MDTRAKLVKLYKEGIAFEREQVALFNTATSLKKALAQWKRDHKDETE